MADWPLQPLREVTTKIGSGATPRGGKSVYVAEGTTFIRSQNVYDNQFSGEDIARISTDAAHALNGVAVESGDVLVNITGESVTRTCSMDARFLPARVSQHVSIVRADPHLVDPAFLLYVLLSPPLKTRMHTLSHAGATRRALTKSHLEGLKVPVPPLSEQQRIAGVLGAFDDLIETNQRTCENLESLATVVAQLACHSVPLKEIALLGETKQVRPTGEVDHFSIPAFDASHRPAKDHGSLIKSGKLSVGKPSVLVSRLNPVTPRTWMAYPDESPAVASTEFVPLVGRGEVSPEQVWAVTNHSEFWEQMRSTASGSTNSRQRVDRAAIPELLVPDPRTLTTDQRDAITTCVCGAEALRRESQDLKSRRDELLPLLMSGKVRVSEVEGSLP